MLAALAPTPAPAPAPEGKPQTGLSVIPLTIATTHGARRFQTEYAGTEAEQATGMMFRPHVPRHTGMLFPMVPNRQATFWMHNTVSSLDLVFIAPGHVVESVAANAKPLSDDIVPSRGIVEAVFEIGPGEAKRLGIHAGDKVAWTDPAR